MGTRSGRRASTDAQRSVSDLSRSMVPSSRLVFQPETAVGGSIVAADVVFTGAGAWSGAASALRSASLTQTGRGSLSASAVAYRATSAGWTGTGAFAVAASTFRTALIQFAPSATFDATVAAPVVSTGGGFAPSYRPRTTVKPTARPRPKKQKPIAPRIHAAGKLAFAPPVWTFDARPSVVRLGAARFHSGVAFRACGESRSMLTDTVLYAVMVTDKPS